MYHKVYKNDISNEWIVLFHGIGGSSTVWYKQLKMLKRKFNVVLVDLPSHGRAENIKYIYGDEYKIENCVSDIKELFRHLFKNYEIDKLHLMGVSLGTVVIHELLKTESEKIKSVVLIGAVISFNKVGKLLINVGTFLKRFVKIKYLYNLMAHILLPSRRNRTSRKLFIKEAKKVKEKEFQKWFYMLEGIESVYNNEVYKEDVTKMYVTGELDHIFLQAVKERTINDKNSTLRIMSKTGHVCNVDNSLEFNGILTEFYNSVL